MSPDNKRLVDQLSGLTNNRFTQAEIDSYLEFRYQCARELSSRIGIELSEITNYDTKMGCISLRCIRNPSPNRHIIWSTSIRYQQNYSTYHESQLAAEATFGHSMSYPEGKLCADINMDTVNRNASIVIGERNPSIRGANPPYTWTVTIGLGRNGTIIHYYHPSNGITEITPIDASNIGYIGDLGLDPKIVYRAGFDKGYHIVKTMASKHGAIDLPSIGETNQAAIITWLNQCLK